MENLSNEMEEALKKLNLNYGSKGELDNTEGLKELFYSHNNIREGYPEAPPPIKTDLFGRRKNQEELDAFSKNNNGRITRYYDMFIQDKNGREVLVFQKIPNEEIRLNGRVIQIDELVKLLKNI